MTTRCSRHMVVQGIQEETALYRRLLRLVRKENDSIVRMDLDALGQIQAMKAKLLRGIRHLAQEGSSFHKEWKGWAKMDSQDLKESLESLVCIMREISRVQSLNGLLLQEALAKVTGEIHDLAVSRNG